MHSRFVYTAAFFLFVGKAYPAPGSDSPITAADSSAAARSAFSLSARAGADYRIPVGKLAEKWGAYPTGGIQLDFPTNLGSTRVRFEGQGGRIPSRREGEVLVLHMGAWVLCDIRTRCPWLRIRPGIGLTNTAVGITDQPIRFEDLEITATWENEFGVGIGAELVLVARKLEVTVPVDIGYTFSSPYPLVLLSVSLFVGVVVR